MSKKTEKEPIETAKPEADKAMFDPQPKTPYERAIADYLEANASDALREKIAEAQKNCKGIAECYDYITEQARKEAKGSNSVMIADAVVFGWAVHYFEDEWQAEIERDKKTAEERKATAERLKREAAERKAKGEAEAAKRKAEAEKTEAERLAALTPEEREAEEKAKKEAEAAARAAEAERRKKELQRQIREQAKREAEERKRKLAEAQMTFAF